MAHVIKTNDGKLRKVVTQTTKYIPEVEPTMDVNISEGYTVRGSGSLTGTQTFNHVYDGSDNNAAYPIATGNRPSWSQKRAIARQAKQNARVTGGISAEVVAEVKQAYETFKGTVVSKFDALVSRTKEEVLEDIVVGTDEVTNEQVAYMVEIQK